MNKNTFMIVGVAVAAIFAVILFFLVSDDSMGPGEEDPDITSSSDPTMPDNDQAVTLEQSYDPQETLARYKKWAQYPPYSRPLHAGQADLLDPYNAERPPRGVLKKKAEGCEKLEGGGMKCAKQAELSDIKCAMTPERTISIGKGDFKVTLSCTATKAGQRPERMKITDIETRFYKKFDRTIIPSLPPIAVGDDGNNGDAQADDNIYTVLVRPTAKDWGYVFVEARFKVGGLDHVQRCNWFSTPYTVAEFQEGVTDRLGAGSLVVSVPMNIRKPGYYRLAANLQEAGGDQRFVASASKGDRLEAGQQNVEFVFFGKILRDKKIDGPYIVREIRGRRDNSPVTPDTLKNALISGTPLEPQEHTEPLYEFIEPLASNYTTGSYRAEDFSDSEWESEQKDRRIQFLTRFAAESGE